ncbi:MAG: dihydrolipoyl dehydrogenase [Rhodospirillaceae bacterium]|nr:dihydrolipoyl dehydrogenase [Rhodospirillaceae bacterium]
MSEDSFDIFVVGGGPGGYVAAIRAAQLGMKTGIVERENLGGICLNWGCIPTKTLLKSAEVFHLLQRSEEYGITAKNVELNIEKIVSRSRNVANQLSNGIKHLMKKNKITVFEGHAEIQDKNSLKIKTINEEITVNSSNIILATGARPRELPNIKPDGDRIWTYKHAMVPQTIPKSVLIIGSGAIGMEFASFYRDLGTEVTVVELLDQILPAEDHDIAKFAAKAFEEQGINILTSSKVTEVGIEKKHARVTIEMQNKNKTEKIIEQVILAVGIIGNTENLGIEKTDIQIKNGHIITDKYSLTGQEGIYAIGDVTGPPWLAHKASHEAVTCVENIAGLKNVHPITKENIPGCTYCRPQIASLGLTESESEKLGHKTKIGKFPFAGNGKALAMGENKGLIKTIFDRETGELLGAHMIGAEVTELIHGFSIAKSMETTERELINTIFPHPTLSEMIHESVLDAYGQAIHI